MTEIVKFKPILPFLQKIWLSLLNLIGQKNEFRIIITSENYIEVKVLYGLLAFQKGEKKEFQIVGTEMYVNSLVNWLSKKDLTIRFLQE